VGHQNYVIAGRHGSSVLCAAFIEEKKKKKMLPRY